MLDSRDIDLARGPVFAHGFSWRKRALLRQFTQRHDLVFVRHAAQVPEGATLLLWGAAVGPAGLGTGVKVVRLEDGFLRSVGLGADLTRPMSWVIDPLGIYFDARQPSALERMLQNAVFSPDLLERAAHFRQLVVAAGLSKYNLAAAPWSRPDTSKPVVLVPGQVETDASIATGTLDIKTNMALLQAVRQARPDAWVVYKPHPDVVAGLRQAGAQEAQAMLWCNEVVLQASMSQLLDALNPQDEVHVMTSLTGFEALLRGIPVVCYGQPFYAGWGLTLDRYPHPRRTRRLSLDGLVAAALLLYPVYVSRVSGQRCSPEQALQELLAWRAQSPGGVVWWRRWLRPLLARA
ncbi:beta-3-deoxy-D-manno-oct-2-ulosonic acid transferase [Limnohabitans sp. WS1]|uniref:capsular polysaccharide export protein, LipB/KpsS family n=1 Tax=Limnohabitans sp. WS1 TaxID=1100726 RepID=UPI001E3A45AA|nr:beta-3-deoxy-D-manno-oct-2-ulosonic acid transferase [Limnohabitans sp. WS1]